MISNSTFNELMKRIRDERIDVLSILNNAKKLREYDEISTGIRSECDLATRLYGILEKQKKSKSKTTKVKQFMISTWNKIKAQVIQRLASIFRKPSRVNELDAWTHLLSSSKRSCGDKQVDELVSELGLVGSSVTHYSDGVTNALVEHPTTPFYLRPEYSRKTNGKYIGNLRLSAAACPATKKKTVTKKKTKRKKR